MSNAPNGKTKPSTATLKAAPKTKDEQKKTPPAKETPRVVIQDRIMKALAGHKDGLSLEALETEGQKLKKVPSGRYSHTAKAEFVTKKDKDGKVTVFPAVSEHGFKVGIGYTLGRGSVHWTIRTFPREALEAAQKLKLPAKDLAALEAATKGSH